jgi:biotin--protein ligase
MNMQRKCCLLVNTGIGLNVGNQKPTTCLNALMQDIVPGAPPFEREEFLAVFLGKFERLFDTFVKEGKSIFYYDFYNPFFYFLGVSQ